jgi:hypothetical protein
MNYLLRFSKIHHTFLHMLFIAEFQTERLADIMNRISLFRYAIKNALHIYRSPAKFPAFLQAVELISHYCLSGQHRFTGGPLADTNVLRGNFPNWNTTLTSNILKLIAASYAYTYYYVTPTAFLILPFHYEVIITRLCDECGEHKKSCYRLHVWTCSNREIIHSSN